MKIPFDISKRPQIESGEYKVETRDGKPARILCWDKVDECGQYIVALVQYTPDHENMISVCEDGTYEGTYGHGYDLFIITPEPELTSWQTFISGCLQKYGLLDCGAADRIAKECSAELLELARKELEPEVLERLEAAYKNQDEVVYENGKRDGKAEALKDLPRWKKVGLDTGQTTLVVGYTKDEDKLYRNGYVISLPDLEKLPGLNE